MKTLKSAACALLMAGAGVLALAAQEQTIPLCDQVPYFPDPSPTVASPWGNGSFEQAITCQAPGGSNCSDNWGLDFLDQEYDHGAATPPARPDNKYRFSLSSVDAVRIYIVDSGIKSQHSELKGADLQSRVQPGVNITRRPLESGRFDTEDCYGNSHGTHVSVIAAGNTYGVAKRALLVPVRLTSSCGNANRSGEIGVEDFVHALDWIIANHPTGTPGIVSYSSNPSLNPDTNPKFVEALRRLVQKGLLFVESAGNDDDDAGPNSFSGSAHPREGVLIVGGLDPRNRRWRRVDANDNPSLCTSLGDCGSNFGPAVDLWAPAQHIVSASNLASSGNSQGICRLSGTSMAAPHVSGLAARLWARYPNASPSAIKAALLSIALSGVDLRCGELPAGEQGTCLASTVQRAYSVFPASGAPVAGDDRFYTSPGQAISIFKNALKAGDLDWDKQSLQLVSVGVPQNGTLEDAGLSVKYTPAPGFVGTDSFTYTIQDSSGNTATANVWVVVEDLDEPPVAWTDCVATAGGPVEIYRDALLTNDWDPEEGGLSQPALLANPAPQQGALSEGPLGDRWIFTPAAGFEGTASFKYYTVEQRLYRIAEGTVLVKVGAGAGACPTPLPDNPVANPDSFTTTVNTSFTFLDSELLENDTPGAVFVTAGQPQHGTLSIDGIAPEGVLYRYEPPAGYTGSDSFSYTIHGNGGVQSSTVATIYVLGSPNVVANPDFLFTKVGTRVRFLSTDLAANDTAGVAFIRAENPQHGTLEIAGIGPEATVYDFVPEPGFTGTASFEYLISPNGFEPYTRGYVTVYVTDDPPTAALTATCSGLTCTFNASGSTDDLGISSYAWTFGDGTTGSGVSVSHTYSVRGSYQADLTVTDTGSQTAASSRVVSVDALPVASFTVSCTGATCSFDASGSTDDVGIASCLWSFGDGSTGSACVMTHTYPSGGDKTVTLTVTDTAGQTDGETKTVRIDLAPTPCFTWVRDGRRIDFNASCSTDDLGISTYTWSFGDGGTGTGKILSHTYATSGSFLVQLTVTDTGSHSQSTSQNVLPDDKPVANFTWSCTLRTCTFDGRSSTDNQPIPIYQWTLGDGNVKTGAVVTHTYAVGGSKTVGLTVTDSVGQQGSVSKNVIVNRPPVANPDSAVTDRNVAVDINVLANDSDPDGDPISVSTWTQPGNGIAAKNPNGTMRYTPAAGFIGSDCFTYQISDTKESSSAATVCITVRLPNKTPDARDDGWSTYQNGPTNILHSHLLANDYDPDGDALTVTGINTAGLTGTLDCSFGTYCRYTPPSWFVGTTSFTYSASDGKGGTDPATIRIKVGVASQAPVPQDDILEAVYNTPLTFTRATLLVNDSDPDGDVLSVTSVYRAPLTAFGSVSCSAANYVCTYTPPAGFTGVDVLHYRASDGITFTDARIRILVRPPNPAVLDAREDETFFTTNGAYLSYVWMTSNDYDPEGGPLTVVNVDTTGLLGTLDCTTFSTGCEYTRGTSDVTRFRYTVRDPQGNLSTTTVTLKPGNWSFNKLPVIANDQLSTRTNRPLAFSIFDVLRNDYDPDNDQLDVMFNFGSTYGRVSCTTPAYFCTYTPNAGFTGTDTLTYWANDRNNSVQGTVTMTVLPVLAKDAQFLSQSVPVSLFAGQSYPVTMRLKNVGTQAWNLVGPQCAAFRLGSVNPYDNTTWGSSRAELPSTVVPGGEVTLSFTITAPSTPGTYNFQRRMVHECVEWFGDLSPNVVVTVSP
jgi:PKD repeat protein